MLDRTFCQEFRYWLDFSYSHEALEAMKSPHGGEIGQSCKGFFSGASGVAIRATLYQSRDDTFLLLTLSNNTNWIRHRVDAIHPLRVRAEVLNCQESMDCLPRKIWQCKCALSHFSFPVRSLLMPRNARQRSLELRVVDKWPCGLFQACMSKFRVSPSHLKMERRPHYNHPPGERPSLYSPGAYRVSKRSIIACRMGQRCQEVTPHYVWSSISMLAWGKFLITL